MNSKILEKALQKVLGVYPQLYSFHALGGNENSKHYKVISESGLFFVKVHEANKFGKVFEKELIGLQTLNKSQSLPVVTPVGTCSVDGFEFLITEFVESAPQVKDFWALLGSKLAQMHQVSSRYYGFSEDNFVGYSVQTNHRLSNWSQFYLKYRLIPHIRMASEKMLIDNHLMQKFEKYCEMAEVIFPEEQPALIHGNLNAQNILVDADGLPIVCNPSVYFGHREMDLAKTRQIGSLPPAFYESYHATFPLLKDWEVRLDFYKMYYDLVNLNTYGNPYLPVVTANLKKWVG